MNASPPPTSALADTYEEECPRCYGSARMTIHHDRTTGACSCGWTTVLWKALFVGLEKLKPISAEPDLLKSWKDTK